MIAAGYHCEAWSQANDVETAIESGHCSTRDRFAIFRSIADVRGLTDGYTEIAQDGSMDGISALAGVNWMVLLPTEDVDRVESVLGGIRKDPPGSEDGSAAAGYTDAELEYLKAKDVDVSDTDEMDYTLESGQGVLRQPEGLQVNHQSGVLHARRGCLA